MSENCIFCKISDRKIPSKVVYEDQHVFAFEDVNPQAPVHILVVPKKHLPDIQSMVEADRELVGHLFLAAAKIAADKGLVEKGYRTVINNGAGAGQTVFHLHLHILSGRRFAWPPG
jgi:histidine triad (HIT) family protein